MSHPCTFQGQDFSAGVQGSTPDTGGKTPASDLG